MGQRTLSLFVFQAEWLPQRAGQRLEAGHLGVFGSEGTPWVEDERDQGKGEDYYEEGCLLHQGKKCLAYRLSGQKLVILSYQYHAYAEITLRDSLVKNSYGIIPKQMLLFNKLNYKL